MEIFVRVDEGCDPISLLAWDAVWDDDSFSADWALAGPTETRNRGGLQATAAIETAVILQLFTDKRCPPNHPLANYCDPQDRRGWWGDGVDVRADLGESEMGSLLWLLERAVATPDIARWAEAFALDALATLVKQGVAVNVTAAASILPLGNGIALDIGVFGQDGARIYKRAFEVVWNQIAPQAGA